MCFDASTDFSFTSKNSQTARKMDNQLLKYVWVKVYFQISLNVREPVRSYKNCLRSFHCMPSDSSVSQGVYWATLRRSLLGLVKFSKKQCNLNNMSTQHIIAKCLLEFNTNFYYFTVNCCHVFNWFFNTTTLVDTVNNSYSTDKSDLSDKISLCF